MLPATAERAACRLDPSRAGSLLLILGCALAAPLVRVGGLALTGDRLLALLALGAFVWLGVGGRVHFTPLHSALALFVGVQVVTTLANAGPWPQGLRFVTVYVLGFACFGLAAEWAHDPARRRDLVTCWIAVGAGLAVVGTVLAAWANLSQWTVWGTDAVESLAGAPRTVYAASLVLREPNLFSSFLLVPFALSLWRWHPSVGARGGGWAAPVSVSALVFGLTFGFTRAAWLAMAGIIALWCWRERPPRRRLSALAAMLVVAFALQAAVVGGSALRFRMLDPIKSGYDHNMEGRLAITRVTVASWLTRPLVGHGAGSINRLSIVRPTGVRLDKIWNGNAVLFVLHDGGPLAVVALLWLGVVVWRCARRAVPDGGAPAGALLAIGGALAFAYQFTHGLWLMYPYLYLGIVAAAGRASASTTRLFPRRVAGDDELTLVSSRRRRA